MSRRKLFSENMETYSLKLRPSTILRLKQLPNGSEVARGAIEERLGVFERDFVSARIKQTEDEIAFLRREMLKLEERKAQDEAILRRAAHQKQDELEARVKFLETAKSLKNPEAWLQSRIDVVAECGFRDVQEAVAYYKEKMVR